MSLAGIESTVSSLSSILLGVTFLFSIALLLQFLSRVTKMQGTAGHILSPPGNGGGLWPEGKKNPNPEGSSGSSGFWPWGKKPKDNDDPGTAEEDERTLAKFEHLDIDEIKTSGKIIHFLEQLQHNLGERLADPQGQTQFKAGLEKVSHMERKIRAVLVEQQRLTDELEGHIGGILENERAKELTSIKEDLTLVIQKSEEFEKSVISALNLGIIIINQGGIAPHEKTIPTCQGHLQDAVTLKSEQIALLTNAVRHEARLKEYEEKVRKQTS